VLDGLTGEPEDVISGYVHGGLPLYHDYFASGWQVDIIPEPPDNEVRG
jgi:hypothetical protein